MLATESGKGREDLRASRMIKSYKHVIWDWNGTIFCDVDLGIEIMNGLLHKRSLPLLTSLSYRDVFAIPVKDYYARLGFDFAKEPFEVVGKLWMDEYELRKFECGLYGGIVGVLDRIQQLGVGQSILSAYSQHTLDQMVDHYELRKYFTHIAGLDNIYAASKLHLGQDLIKRLGVGKQEAVVVGDTEHDYEVARAMDADCILIANGHQSKTRLQALGVPVLDDARGLVH
jgi:phosphoglycolate phosphatase